MIHPTFGQTLNPTIQIRVNLGITVLGEFDYVFFLARASWAAIFAKPSMIPEFALQASQGSGKVSVRAQVARKVGITRFPKSKSVILRALCPVRVFLTSTTYAGPQSC